MKNNVCNIDENFVVSKSNEFTTCGFSRNMGLDSLRVIYIAISTIEPEDKEFKEVQFTINNFCELFNIKSTQGKNTQAKMLARKILKETVEIKINGTMDTEEYTIFKSLKFEGSKGLITFKFNDDMKKFLLHLSNHFTSYRLKNITNFKSSYSCKVYDYCKTIQFKKSTLIDLEEFKYIIGADNYNQYSHVKSKAIEPAIKEINEKSDIFVTYKPIKEGRKIVALYFEIETNKANFNKNDKCLINKVVEPKAIAPTENNQFYNKKKDLKFANFTGRNNETYRNELEQQFFQLQEEMIYQEEE